MHKVILWLAVDLNVEEKIKRHLKDTIANCLHDFGIGKVFLNRIQKH